MAITETTTVPTAGLVELGGVRLWAERRGDGPDVLLIAGLSDPAEAWQYQLDGLADRYRVTAFDNRGSGRTACPDGPLSVRMMADDAAALLRSLGIEGAHVAGFSGGSAIAQELTLNHPELVRSLVLVSTFGRTDAHFRSMCAFWQWMVDAAPDDRAMLEAFYLWIYTPRAHEDGTVAQFIDDALAFPHPQSIEDFQRQLEAFRTHETIDRLSTITAPTLVVAGGVDRTTPPHMSRAVADAIPGAEFVLLPEEAHQPFQERPAEFNELVDAFWRRADGRA